MRSGAFLAVLFGLVVACSSSSQGETTCAAAGGTCVNGAVACVKDGPYPTSDCEPNHNPGGSHCCLVASDGGIVWTPADASASDTGTDHE
jgi:hypothetical protein